MSFVRGFVAPFRGALFVVEHRLGRYVLGPALLNLALAIAAALGAARLARRAIPASWLQSSPAIASVLFFLVAALLTLALFLLLAPVVTAPFLDLLSERVEKIVRGAHPEVGFVASTWAALLHGVLKLLLYASALLVAFTLSTVTGVGGLLGVALYALFLAYDGFDYPLARRKVGFLGKWRYLALHPGQTVGYCLGASLLHLVPLAIFVAPAFAAVGATLAYLDAPETADDAPRGMARPSS